MVLLHLKAIFILVCLKRLVIFLICGDIYWVSFFSLFYVSDW